MNQLSAWYPSHASHDTEPGVCGTLAIAARDWVDERLVSGAFTRIANRHDGQWPTQLREDHWYRARTVQHVLEHVLEYGESIETASAEIASRCVPQLLREAGELSGAERLTQVLGQADLLLHCVVNFGTLEPDLNLRGLFEAWVHGIPCDLEWWFRGLWQGFAAGLMHASAIKESSWHVLLSENCADTTRLYLRCRYR